MKVDLFQYTDYRKLLADLLIEIRKTDAGFTHRHIAAKLGLKSSAFFALVLSGKRNLSEKLIIPTAVLFGLDKRKTAYFELLVRYSHCSSQLEKQFYFERISRFLKARVRTVSPDKYEFYEKWYYPVIREILGYHNFQGDFKALAALTRPAISPAEAKKSIEVLERLNLIQKNKDGRYLPTDAIITAGDEWQSQAIRNLQATYIDLAKEALHQIPKDRRDISNLTLSISQDTFVAITEKIRSLRRELLELAKNDHKADGVYLVNFQAFPVTLESQDTSIPSC